MLTEQGDIGGIGHLRVFDAPAPVAREIGGQLVDRGQGISIGGIADGMDRHLETVHRRAAHQVPQLRAIQHFEPAMARLVGIGLLEQRPARAERAIEPELDPVQPQPVVIQPLRRPRPADQQHGRHAIGIGHDAQVQPPGVASAAEGHPVLDRGAHVGHRRHAMAEEFDLRLVQGKVGIGGARRRHVAGDKRHGIVNQHAGRRARSGLSHDLAACRVCRLRGHAACRKRRTAGPDGMAVGAFQHHRAIAHHGIEFGGGGEPAQAPGLLVPAAPDKPGPRREFCGIGGQQRLRFLQRAGARKVERQLGKAGVHDMGMAVDEAGQHGPTFEIDVIVDLRFGPVAEIEQLHDPPVFVHDHAGKAVHAAVAADRHAVDIVEMGSGKGRGGKTGQDACCQQGYADHLPACGIWRTSALVSCRPPPMACTRA